MIDPTPFVNLVPLDDRLRVVVTCRADHTPHTAVVNAGVRLHPLTDSDRRVRDPRRNPPTRPLRTEPSAPVVVRAARQWTIVEGTAQVIGPDDAHPDVNSEQLRFLLRNIFSAAGGTHDNCDTYDRVM